MHLKNKILKFTYIWKVKEDERYIRKCLELAKLGDKWVQPNPMVGSVITRNGELIAEGYHHKLGEAHAEVNAIKLVDDQDLTDCTIYVNLEPCSHHGKTPPCANVLIEKRFKRVVIGALDPNPLVSGSGIERIKAAGIAVEHGILEHECRALNKVFYHFHEKKKPFITLKWAETKDGFIGRHNSEEHLSNQISNEACKTFVHELRAKHMAILIGANTANRDKPQLNLRYAEGRDPIKVIMSKNNSIHPDLKLFNSGRVIVYNSLRSSSDNNVEYVKVHHKHFLSEMLQDLYQRNISSVLVEGGAQVHQSLIDHGLFNEIYQIIGKPEWGKGVKAASVPLDEMQQFSIDDNQVYHYIKS